MADDQPTPPEQRASPAWLSGIKNVPQWLWAHRTPGQALYLPTGAIRAALASIMIGSMMYLQWVSPSQGAVPNGLVALGSGAAGFYLGAQNSIHMKALIALLVIGLTCAFYLERNWIPESLVSLASTVFGMYFSKMMQGVTTVTSTVTPAEPPPMTVTTTVSPPQPTAAQGGA